MRKLGFQEEWIRLIMMYVTTVSYSVLINGEPKEKITLTRGLRQGDPISPYLFLLYAEGLTAMLRRDEREGLINGISLSCRRAPRISHLLFANDCIIFREASVREGNRVLKVLDDYERESGQKLNREKTLLFSSKNTRREIQEEIKNSFGAQIIHKHERYLGLPTLVGRGKRKAFNGIKDQVGTKIAGWKGKLLSNIGREILIKVVAQITPTYIMSCFKLPNSLCRELNSSVSQFWWGQKDKERKMAWISWESMCTPKSEGGMDFKDLKAFNLVLLAKQGWQLSQHPESLTHRVFKAKYFVKCTFMEAQVGKKPSYVWRSLMATKETIKAGSRWLVGNGRKVNIWHDRWLPSPDSFKVISPQRHNTDVEKVAQLIDSEAGTWKAKFIREVFLPHEAEIILSIPLSP